VAQFLPSARGVGLGRGRQFGGRILRSRGSRDVRAPLVVGEDAEVGGVREADGGIRAAELGAVAPAPPASVRVPSFFFFFFFFL